VRTQENESFADFVSAEQAGLLRLAVLLAGDRGQAEDLVQTALMNCYRHWGRIIRSGSPSAYVRRALVTTHTPAGDGGCPRRSRSWRHSPDLADPHPLLEPGDEQLRQALRALPPRMRTARVSTGACGSEIRPTGTPLDELVVVLRCGSDGGPENAPADSLVVVAPADATTAQALDDGGEQIASHPLDDGVAVVPAPLGLDSVAVIDADGVVVDVRGPMAEVDFGP
jgi:hypothetical protein